MIGAFIYTIRHEKQARNTPMICDQNKSAGSSKQAPCVAHVYMRITHGDQPATQQNKYLWCLFTPNNSKIAPIMPKVKTTVTTLTRHNLNKYKMDLLEVEDMPLIIDCPYKSDDDWTSALTITLRLLDENMRIRNRIATLAYAFYAGKLLNDTDEPRQSWKAYVEQHPRTNEIYYYKGILRTFKIFEENPKQIFNTRKISFWALKGMSTHDFENDLLPFARVTINIDSLIG